MVNIHRGIYVNINRKSVEFRTKEKNEKRGVFYSVYPLSHVTTVFDDETGITANSNRYSNSAATMKLKRLAGTAYNQLKGLIKRND